MDAFLLPADPAAPIGRGPASGLIGAQLLGAVVLGLLVSVFSDARGGWVSMVAALAVSQSLGLWWEQRRPGSVTPARRVRLALLAAAVQLVLAVPFLLLALGDEDGWVLVAAIAFALPLHALATWFGVGYGVTLARRVKPPPAT